MGKPRYANKPRSIVQKRRSKKSKHDTLLVTIPAKVTNDWNLSPGQIVEFSTLVDGQDTFVKLKKVTL